MKKYKIKSIVLFLVVMLVVGTVTATAFAETNAGIASAGSNLSKMQLQEDFGEMKQIETNEKTGAKKYMDDKYVYWFDANDRLMSRVLVDVSSQTEKRSMTRDAALQLATKEIATYVDGFSITQQIEVDVNHNDEAEANTPWEIKFVMRNVDNVICNTYQVVIDIYGDVCLMFISEQQPATEKANIDKTAGYNIALNAISKDMSTTYKKNITPEAIMKENNIETAHQELYAYNGQTIWSLTLSNFKHSDTANFKYSYFVQVDAVSGEILYIGKCRNGVLMN